MLQQQKADDYVLATNHETSVRDFVTMVLKNLNYYGKGKL